MRIAGLLLAFCLSIAFVTSDHAAAATDEAVVRGEIRSVIDGQITAFQADDGPAAYAYASPEIRRIFPSVDGFMSMVRSGYQPVYRPKSVAYGRLKEEAGAFFQEVFVVGADGESYTALYALTRQPDGAWKISGCTIVKTPGRSA